MIYGEEENDRIIPGPDNDKVLGSAGNDRILGWAERGGEIVDDGTDILNGGWNDDVIEAGGADSLFGFTHDDLLRTRTPAVAPAIMDGGGNDDTIYGSEVADNIRGGERLSGRDTVYGAGGDDQIIGDGNDDELFGQLGDDDLFGGDGFDLVDGGHGTDSCDGGELDDEARTASAAPRSRSARSLPGADSGRSDLRIAVNPARWPVAPASGRARSEAVTGELLRRRLGGIAREGVPAARAELVAHQVDQPVGRGVQGTVSVQHRHTSFV